MIRYTYDASGNRISKQTATDTTFYVRDASGNVLAVYSRPAGANSKLGLAEVHLYGSSRLGMTTKHLAADSTLAMLSGFGSAKKIIFTRGEKLFELFNHLGNVLVTVTDRRIQLTANNTDVSSYRADIASANDYYPFGMLMPGRRFTTSTYRYGFNGKENDNEIKGEGNEQDYGMRIYDSRIGKFLSVDPLAREYSWYTPFQFAGNSPVKFIDLDGLEPALPKVIGITYAKLKKLTSAEIEENLTSLNVSGLSISYLKALVKEEGLSLSIYDVDNKVSKLKTASGRGGNATIGFGHLVHYGAIGSTQYDKDALTKEEAYTDGQITISEAFSILSEDLSTRMTGLNNSLSTNKITNAPQGVKDLFMDLIYNTGSANRAIKIYKKGGVLGLYLGLKNVSSDKKKNIKSVSNSRKNMRLELIKEDLQKENFEKAADDPRKNIPKQETENVGIALIRLSTGEYILKINRGKKCLIIVNS